MGKEDDVKLIKKVMRLNIFHQDTKEALGRAAKVLEQEACEDCVSRKKVIEIICGGCPICRSPEECIYRKEKMDDDYCGGYYILHTLPSVQPNQKTGYWIDTGSGQKCSRCGEIQYGYDSFRRYCANCGSKNIED